MDITSYAAPHPSFNPLFNTSMKSYHFLLPMLSLAALPLAAQVTVVAPTPIQGPVTPATSVVVDVQRDAVNPAPAVRVFDSTSARRQLSIEPRVVVVPTAPAAPVTTTTVIPGLRTETTTTTTGTYKDIEGHPRRAYIVDRNVVIVKDQQQQTRELPYVAIPVLFVKSTADLLDTQSAAAIQQMADVIREVSSTNPNARFDIEGHTSTDGTDEMNMSLSAMRAQRVYDELTQRYNVPPSTLSAHGYGENFPSYPDGTEEQMQLDRRVLVVRTQ